jgi:hypothetical protein
MENDPKNKFELFLTIKVLKIRINMLHHIKSALPFPSTRNFLNSYCINILKGHPCAC